MTSTDDRLRGGTPPLSYTARTVAALTSNPGCAWRAVLDGGGCHPAGTCRIGTDDLAVVDPELRVHYVSGLRVADASVMRSIVAGLTEDKPGVAARAAYHGLGVNLQTATPAPEAVAASVESVLKDDGMRDNVRKLAQVYAAHDPLTEIERLALA